MPIYEYQCEKCGEVFEATQRISEPPLKKHEACGSKKVKKLISATSFQLKGAGWYVTDYKKSSDKPTEKNAEKTDTKTEKAETKADTKTDAKTEPKPEKKAEAKVEKKGDKSAA